MVVPGTAFEVAAFLHRVMILLVCSNENLHQLQSDRSNYSAKITLNHGFDLLHTRRPFQSKKGLHESQSPSYLAYLGVMVSVSFTSISSLKEAAISGVIRGQHGRANAISNKPQLRVHSFASLDGEGSGY